MPASVASNNKILEASQKRQQQLQILLTTDKHKVAKDSVNKRQILHLLLQAEEELQMGTSYDMDTVLSDLESL